MLTTIQTSPLLLLWPPLHSRRLAPSRCTRKRCHSLLFSICDRKYISNFAPSAPFPAIIIFASRNPALTSATARPTLVLLVTLTPDKIITASWPGSVVYSALQMMTSIRHLLTFQGLQIDTCFLLFHQTFFSSMGRFFDGYACFSGAVGSIYNHEDVCVYT